jgi:uncharacterized protein YxjI
MERPFAFFWPLMHIFDETVSPKRYIGTIQTQFSLFTREYKILDCYGKEVYQISGNMFEFFHF